jgi:hypothetical protein
MFRLWRRDSPMPSSYDALLRRVADSPELPAADRVSEVGRATGVPGATATEFLDPLDAERSGQDRPSRWRRY